MLQKLWSLGRSLLVGCTAISFLHLASCTPDEVVDPPVETASKRLLVLNEGNFQRGNASLSALNLDTHQMQHKVFERSNGRSLGDVAQSIHYINEQLFVVLNNSGRIEVLNPDDYSSIATIEGFTSPRYVLPIDDERAIVSDLYANALTVINVQTHQKTGTIKLHGWTENMVLLEDDIVTTNMRHNKVYVLDKSTLNLQDSIAIGGLSEELFVGEDDAIWVLRMSDQAKGTEAAWLEMDMKQRKVVDSIIVPTEGTTYSASSSYSAKHATCWFVLSGDVHQFDVANKTLQSSVIRPETGETFYNLLVQDDFLWLTDVGNYNERGQLLKFTISTLTEPERYDMQIIPSSMLYLD